MAGLPWSRPVHSTPRIPLDQRPNPDTADELPPTESPCAVPATPEAIVGCAGRCPLSTRVRQLRVPDCRMTSNSFRGHAPIEQPSSTATRPVSVYTESARAARWRMTRFSQPSPVGLALGGRHPVQCFELLFGNRFLAGTDSVNRRRFHEIEDVTESGLALHIDRLHHLGVVQP